MLTPATRLSKRGFRLGRSRAKPQSRERKPEPKISLDCWERRLRKTQASRAPRPKAAGERPDRAARRTANATWVIAFFTFVTVCVGYAQWRALRSTDDATHTVAEAALKQAEAADRQVIAMQSQLDEMKRQSAFTVVQLRPKPILSFKGPERQMRESRRERRLDYNPKLGKSWWFEGIDWG